VVVVFAVFAAPGVASADVITRLELDQRVPIPGLQRPRMQKSMRSFFPLGLTRLPPPRPAGASCSEGSVQLIVTALRARCNRTRSRVPRELGHKRRA
jgi:hypothetical protein